MRGIFCNLFPLELEGSIKLHRYKVFWKEGFSEREHVNKLLYEVGERVKKPVVYKDGHLYSFVGLKEEEESTASAILRREGISAVNSLGEGVLDARSLGQIANFFERKARTFKVYTKDDVVILGKPIFKVYEVGKHPYICVDFKMRLLSKRNLQEEIEAGVGEDDIVGKEFRAMTAPSGYSFIVREVFTVDEEEIERYKALSKSEDSRDAWRRAGRLLRGGKEVYAVRGVFRKSETPYTYPALALRRVITLDELDKGAFKYIKYTPKERMRHISSIKGLAEKELRSINVMVKDSHPSPEYINHVPSIYDATGRDYRVPYNIKSFLESKEFTPFLRKSKIKLQPVFVGIENKTLRKDYKTTFEEHIVKYLKDIGIELELLKPMYTEKAERESIRESLGEGFREIVERKRPDIVVVFLREFKDSPSLPGNRTLYDIIKEQLSFSKIPSQVILERTIGNMDKFKAMNIVLGILGKTGNYPYKVRLEGKTLYVGIDVSRRETEKRKGSLNMAGICKFFSPDGSFIEYIIKKFSMEGEVIEDTLVDFIASEIKRLSSKGFTYDKVVIHRDGPVHEREKKAFKDIFSERGIENFELVSIVKRGNPRLFERRGNDFVNPRKNLFLPLNDKTFILTTYHVNDSIGTHQPLRISVEIGNTDAKTLAKEILTLTLLNYSSFTLGKLPATISHADKLARFALEGFIDEGRDSRMFWL